MSALEIAANLVNLISIVLAARNHVLTWPTGILGCLLFGLLFFQSHLYADVTLQIFFIGTSVVGWRQWRRHADGQEKPISPTSLAELGLYAVFGVISALLYGALLHHFTDASYPFIDSMVLAFSVIAQLLLMNRRLENWYFWILVNIISIPLYFMKDLYLTAGIYFLFLINAIWGLKRWRKDMPRSTTRFRFGLVVGKFSPLHKGHESLIRHALRLCENVGIISYSQPEFPGFEGPIRKKWLQDIFPEAQLLVLPAQVCPHNDAHEDDHRQFVAQHCYNSFDRLPDAVFANEDYGPGFAAHLSRVFGHNVSYVRPDPGRQQWPISGTRIRADVHAHRDFLSPRVYADFVDKICFLGGESTGKSTLSQRAAAMFQTTCVPEYGRTLWEEKKGVLEFADMLRIAETHIQHEEQLKLQARRFLFIDTSPLTTLFYSYEMFGHADSKLEELAERKYTHIFLCEPDFAFVQDGTRQDDAFRQRQHLWYQEALSRRSLRSHRLSGSLEERLATLKSIIDP